MTKEVQNLGWLLRMHVRSMAHSLRQIPADKWDWTFAPPAPTPRILAAHTLSWLICDRQHIEQPDAVQHALVPGLPTDPAAACDALDAEIALWDLLLGRLTPEDLDAPRSQFNEYLMTVRQFLGHIVQNSIYKNGQMTTIFYALGLDGDAPYDAPFPNPIYAALHETTPEGQSHGA